MAYNHLSLYVLNQLLILSTCSMYSVCTLVWHIYSSYPCNLTQPLSATVKNTAACVDGQPARSAGSHAGQVHLLLFVV